MIILVGEILHEKFRQNFLLTGHFFFLLERSL